MYGVHINLLIINRTDLLDADMTIDTETHEDTDADADADADGNKDFMFSV